MKVALLFLLACAVAVVDVQSAVYVPGGTRYPWPAPNRTATNGSKTVQQNRRTSTAINSNRIRTRRADGSSVIVHQNPAAVFEEQHPIDFDLKVRPSVQFVPGLKSVIDLPARTKA